jgi:hypothetical protein
MGQIGLGQIGLFSISLVVGKEKGGVHVEP